MCEHHKPAQKLQRFCLYVAAGVIVIITQYYTL